MSETKYTLEVICPVTVTGQDIDDIMVAALEGGITYWCREAKVVGDFLGDYASEQISRGGKLTLHDAESEKVWELDRDKFLNGIKLWIQNGMDEYHALGADGTLDCCEIDSAMADLIIQFAIFGEIIFG